MPSKRPSGVSRQANAKPRRTWLLARACHQRLLLSSSALGLALACSSTPEKPHDGAGGAATSSMGGSAGAEGSNQSLGEVVFEGAGIWLLPDNGVGVQGSFFILEDSVENDTAVLSFPQLDLTELWADSGGDEANAPVSHFTPETDKPCVSGTLPRVTNLDGHTCTPIAGDCAWDQQWGGGIGLSLSQPAGSTQPGTWNAVAWIAHGFRFRTSGDLGGARLRLKVTDRVHKSEFCTELSGERSEREVELIDLRSNCWDEVGGGSGEALDRTQIMELHFQLVPDADAEHRIDSFCIEQLAIF